MLIAASIAQTLLHSATRALTGPQSGQAGFDPAAADAAKPGSAKPAAAVKQLTDGMQAALNQLQEMAQPAANAAGNALQGLRAYGARIG
ncbi:MAG TPA: hypothetical protein VGC80_09600 [Acetobacteraceae bacterium]|jgi:hypothetical protein